MADYQKVETGQPEEAQAFSQEDIRGLQEESDAQDLAQEERMVQEEQKEAAVAAETRPEWLPEKFNSPEDLAKAYADLETEYTKGQQDGAEGGDTEEGKRDSGVSMSADDFAAFNQEFTETGDISEEGRALAESWGIPRDIVDGYIAGQQAILNTHFNDIYSEVGGEGRYDEMVGWARENIPEGEQNAFNDSVVNGSSDQMMFAIRSLAGRWMASTGASSGTPLIQGDTGSSGASGAFRSTAELTSAMKDPRYQKDPAYRQDVQNRLANSNIF